MKQKKSANITIIFIFFSAVLFGFIWSGNFQSGGSFQFNIFRIVLLPILASGMIWVSLVVFQTKPWAIQIESSKIDLFPYIFAVIYIALLSYFKFSKLYSFNYEIFDAGLYYNILWITANASLEDAIKISLTQGHFQPINLIFWFIGKLLPVFETAMIIETVLLASGIIAIYKLTNLKLRNKFFSLFLSASYALFPLVQFNDILGYHPDHFILPFLIWGFFFLEGDKKNAAFACFACILLTTENWFPMASAVGLGLFVGGYCKLRSLILTTTSCALFLFVTFILLPYFGSENAGQNVFSEAGNYQIITNPSVETLLRLFSDTNKFLFLWFIFLPFLFTPLFYTPSLIMLIPDLAKTLLSLEPLHFALEGHYTLSFVAISYWAFIKILSKLQINKGKSVGFCVCHCLLIALTFSIAHGIYPISYNFWSNISAKTFHYSNYMWSPRASELQVVEKIIGSNPDIKVQVSNDIFTPMIGDRKNLSLFPNKKSSQMDYIILGDIQNMTTGAESQQSKYAKTFNEMLKNIENCFEAKKFKTLNLYIKKKHLKLCTK